MMGNLEGSVQQFALELRDELQEMQCHHAEWCLDGEKADIFASACAFLYRLSVESFGEVTWIDAEPGAECTAGALFDDLEISGELLRWFRELLLQVDNMSITPGDEEETVVLSFGVEGVWG